MERNTKEALNFYGLLPTISEEFHEDLEDIVISLPSRDRKIISSFNNSNEITEKDEEVFIKSLKIIITILELKNSNKGLRFRSAFSSLISNTNIQNNIVIRKIMEEMENENVDIYRGYFIENKSIIELSSITDLESNEIDQLLYDFVKQCIKKYKTPQKIEYNQVSIFKSFNEYTPSDVYNAIMRLESEERHIVYSLHGESLVNLSEVDYNEQYIKEYETKILPKMKNILLGYRPKIYTRTGE